MKDKILFFSTFLRHPKEIGSIIPSSKFLINEVLKNIDFENSAYIVEYGSGTGHITTEILKRARKDAKLLCFETNKTLCTYLGKIIKDKRAIVINDTAENIAKYLKKYGINEADCIVAVLSFSTLGKIKKNDILKETKKALRLKGKFVFCRYIPHFERHLSNYFSKSYVNFVFLNIPPSLVYTCEK